MIYFVVLWAVLNPAPLTHNARNNIHLVEFLETGNQTRRTQFRANTIGDVAIIGRSVPMLPAEGVRGLELLK